MDGRKTGRNPQVGLWYVDIMFVRWKHIYHSVFIPSINSPYFQLSLNILQQPYRLQARERATRQPL